MISSHCVILTSEYAQTLWVKYDFQPQDEVLIPLDGASFLEPPPRKVDVFVNVYYWVKGPYFRTERTSDSAPRLLGQDQEADRLLESFTVAPQEFPEYILIGTGMSTEW
ncbi:unnamed protein product [Lactuca saligna]|uniref:Uncharacterized protein n=1 Tax=Lactuca saligna TaxID=75948 RepID=A0AA36A5I1_LACSI|nr:unnamed protein product [Lactuca saligna]